MLPLSNGGVLVADGGSDQIRRVSPLGFVYTVAGGRRGLGGDGGPESAALLDTPTSLAPQGGGILVADSGNSRVRRLADIGQLPPPRALQTIGVAPVDGSVSVAPRGVAAAIPLREADLAPNVSRVDATAGTIQLAVQPLDAPDDAVAQVSGGSFTVVQPVADTAVADLRLNAPLACPTPAQLRARARAAARAKAKAKARAKARARARAKAGATATARATAPAIHATARARATARPPSRRVRIKVRGAYRTTGRYATAVANGTEWTMIDGCDRTVIRVTEGTVTVYNATLKKNVKVTAGHTYTARRPAVK